LSIFVEHLECGKIIKYEWNEIAKVGLHQTSLSCIKIITFFLNKC